MEEGGRCEGLRRGRRACTMDGAEGAEVCGSGSGHRGHTSVLAATSTCSERGTSDGLSSGLSSGLTWRRTALRGASAGLRQSACATSASRSTAARNIATRQAQTRSAPTRRRGKTIHKEPHARVAKARKKTYNSPFASAELDILRRRFTFSFVARNMLLVPSLIGSAFMPGASLSLGRSTVSAPAPVVMAVAPKKIAVGVIGTGLVGAELLEQAAPAPAASSPPPSPAAPPPPPPPPSKPTAHLLACPPLFTTTAGVVQGGAAEAGAGHHGGVDLEDQGQRRR